MRLVSLRTPQTPNERLVSHTLKTLWVAEIKWLTQESFGLKPDRVLIWAWGCLLP